MGGGPSPGAPAGTELEWVWQQLAKGREPNLAELGQSWLAGDAQAGVRAGGTLGCGFTSKAASECRRPQSESGLQES